MPEFASARERRLWSWAVVVALTILGSIPLARQAAGLVPGWVLGVVFSLAWLLVLVTIATQGLRVRPGGLEIGLVLGVAACWMLVVVRLASPVERSHLVEYGVLAVLVYEALTERAGHGGGVRAPALLAIALTVAVGTLDEGLQWLVPGRVFDWRDLLFNFVAAVMAVPTMAVLRWARRRRVSSRPTA